MSRRKGQLKDVTVQRRAAIIEVLLTGPKTTTEVVAEVDSAAGYLRSCLWYDLRVMEQRGLITRERPIERRRRVSRWRILETAH